MSILTTYTLKYLRLNRKRTAVTVLGAIAACVLGILAIVFATMMVSGAMIRNDNIVDTLKEENL